MTQRSLEHTIAALLAQIIAERPMAECEPALQQRFRRAAKAVALIYVKPIQKAEPNS